MVKCNAIALVMQVHCTVARGKEKPACAGLGSAGDYAPCDNCHDARWTARESATSNKIRLLRFPQPSCLNSAKAQLTRSDDTIIKIIINSDLAPLPG